MSEESRVLPIVIALAEYRRRDLTDADLLTRTNFDRTMVAARTGFDRELADA